MGFGDRLRAVFGMRPQTFDEPRTARFSAVYPVDQLVLWAENRVGRIDRERALGVPAVLRGRNMICSISTLPLEAVDEDNRVQARPLFRQLDPNTPNVVVLAQTLEDLLFDAVSWWRVVGFDAEGYPSRVQRYAPDQVSLQPPDSYQRGYLPSGLPTEGVVWMEGKPVPFDQVIRFDSPNPALMVAGERPIRRAIALDDAAELYANNPRRRGYFAPSEGADPADDNAILDALDAWHEASNKRVDGYVPYALTYNAIQDSTPAELQLVQMQQRADLALANALGIDPEDLGINTTSRTYQNATDRRQDRINEVLAPYMRAITDRLGMPDVTRDGLTVRFSLRDYLKADPKTRAEVQQIYHGMGATDAAEVREDEGRPPKAIEQPQAPRRVSSTVGEPVQEIEATRAPAATFAREGLTFAYEPDGAFAVDLEARTITGLAVPWGQVARSGGKRYRFAKGSVKWSSVNRVKLLRDHVTASAIGKAIALEVTDAGLMATFKVSPGAAGDEALALAVDEVLDGLSIGVDFRDTDLAPDPQNPGALLVTQAALREVSLTAVPAFDDSRLTSVQAAREEGSGMPEETQTEETPAPAPVTFSNEQFDQLLARLTPPAPAERPTVDPTRNAPAQVTESLPYRFSAEDGRTVFRSDAEHDFSADLFAAMNPQSSAEVRIAAEKRVNGLIRAAFDVDRADTADINPNRYRPDMWQPQMDYATPLWDMVGAGTTDGRSFDVPKFNSASGLVGPATETVEPAGGAFTVTDQTITPTQVWGKVEITRQAWRRGGSPQLSGILWDQMLREYYEDREAAVATFLATLTAATDITLPGVDASPDNTERLANAAALEAAIADLQFVRGGNRFRAFAVHQALYRLLAAVTDTSGRPLYPQIAPSNANGTTRSLFSTINIAGTTAVPSYALGAAGGNTSVNSWLFDPAKVLGWASAPERLFWDFGATVQTANIPQLSYVTLGIYGDVAFANLDINGVRQVVFDQNTAA
jgi:HK97 family phage prohead protease